MFDYLVFYVKWCLRHSDQLRLRTVSVLTLQVRGYLGGMPRGLGGSRWRSSPSAAEARAALEVLKGLTAAGDGGPGGDDKANLEYLTVRMNRVRESRTMVS